MFKTKVEDEKPIEEKQMPVEEKVDLQKPSHVAKVKLAAMELKEVFGICKDSDASIRAQVKLENAIIKLTEMVSHL